MTWKPKVKTFQIAKDIPHNIKIPITMTVTWYSCPKWILLFLLFFLNIFNSPFDLDVMHIEKCDFYVTWMILTKTCAEHHFIMHINVKTRFYWLQLNKLGYVFQEIIFRLKLYSSHCSTIGLRLRGESFI